MTASLINPIQLRAYGVTVQDNSFADAMSMSNGGEEEMISISMFAVGINITINLGHLNNKSSTHVTYHPYLRHRVGAQEYQVSTNRSDSRGRVHRPGIGSRGNL
jgi:hypothetical protein